MLLQHIIDIIERVAPGESQEAWDNSGLQVGDPTADVRAALLTIDVTESLVSYAVSHGFDLILSHHPLLFHGLKHLTGSTPQERCVAMAIRHGVAIYSAHTNLDKAGVSGRMAQAIGIEKFVPLTEDGFGAIGEWSEAMDVASFAALVKERFGVPFVRHSAWEKPIRRVAMCGGAGAEFWEQAVAAGADVYLTSDCKYHDFQAAEGRICLMDIDHWAGEQFARNIYKELLDGVVPTEICPEDASFVRVK